MPDVVERIVEGHRIILSGSLVCPHPDWCDQNGSESYEEYVRRHARQHNLGEFKSIEDAERNLGLWCFYFDHKYVWGNRELHPYPHWEIHAFVAEWEWSETDLQQRTPLKQRKVKGYLPPADQRRTGERRRFKQIEVPRQCQKTSIGARAYSVFRAKHEYFINDKRNYRIIIRSATSTLVRQSLNIIRRMSGKSQKLAQLYGVWLFTCGKCMHREQVPKRLAKCSQCDGAKNLRHRRIALIDPSQGSGSLGADEIAFRWLTGVADAVAAYSIWIAGLKTETTGQRPDLYIWDDPQTRDNSDTVEKREAIKEKFDGSWREKQFNGEMLVFDTRKYMGDFAGAIQKEPLVSLFFSLRREVRWRTDEPDNPPWVVDGWRYYYPLRGDGQRALDATEVRELRKQKEFSAEYMNDPLDEESATFKRSDFIIVSRSEDRAEWPEHQKEAVPLEIYAGLGRAVSADEQRDLDAMGVRINAMNACDPADAKKSGSDETFVVAARLDRYGRPYITGMDCGRWAAKKRWSRIERLSTYNAARFTDYEMGTEEDDIQASFEKWVRDTSDELTVALGVPTTVRPPMHFSRMPKSNKEGRIREMEAFLPIYILDDAGDPDLIEKFISQWVGLGVEDHDDGPDATSRLLTHFTGARRRPAKEEDKKTWVDPDDGAAYVPLAQIKAIAGRKPQHGLWGEQGGSPKCMHVEQDGRCVACGVKIA